MSYFHASSRLSRTSSQKDSRSSERRRDSGDDIQQDSKRGTKGAPLGTPITTQKLEELITTMRLPQMSVPTFSGRSRDEYWEFKLTLQRHIREALISDAVKLEMFISAYNGHVKESPPRLPTCRKPRCRVETTPYLTRKAVW